MLIVQDNWQKNMNVTEYSGSSLNLDYGKVI